MVLGAGGSPASDRLSILTAGGADGALLVAAILTASPSAAVREDTSARGAVDLLWRYDAPRLRGLRIRTMRGLDAATASRARLAQNQRVSAARRRPAARRLRGHRLVLGRHRAPNAPARFWSRRLRRLCSAALTGHCANPARIRFELPVPVARVSVTVSDETLARAVTQVTLEPRAVVPVAAREEPAIRTIEPVPGAPEAYVIYSDGMAFPGGRRLLDAWDSPARVLVAPVARRDCVLTALARTDVGRRHGHVSADRRSTVRVPANDATRVLFDLPSGVRTVPVIVESPTMFRPSEVDPGLGRPPAPGMPGSGRLRMKSV